MPDTGRVTLHALAIRHLAFEDLGLLDPLLRARGFQIDYLDAGLDPITEDALVAPDLAVVLGGPIGVYESDTYPFLVDEKAAIAARLAAHRPIIGVCLGAQLMAAALGAPVTPTGRKEIGYAALQLTPAGRNSELAAVDGIPVLHWHGDEFAIPDGAKRLAETPGFPNQAFMLDDFALGLQFHIEADHRRIEQWLIGHTGELAAAHIDPRTIRADAAAYGPALEQAAKIAVAGWLEHLPRS